MSPHTSRPLPSCPETHQGQCTQPPHRSKVPMTPPTSTYQMTLSGPPNHQNEAIHLGVKSDQNRRHRPNVAPFLDHSRSPSTSLDLPSISLRHLINLPSLSDTKIPFIQHDDNALSSFYFPFQETTTKTDQNRPTIALPATTRDLLRSPAISHRPLINQSST